MAQKEPVPMCPMCQKRRKEMELTLTQYFLLFMIYSVAGWVLEVTCKLIEYKRFINRGVLNRSILPNIWMGSSCDNIFVI